MSSVYFKEHRTTWSLSSRGLVNFNTQVNHTIHRTRPRAAFVYTFIEKWSIELKITPFFPNCIIEIIQVTERSKYFPRGPHVLQLWTIRVKIVLSGISDGKGLPDFAVFQISGSYSWLYLSVSKALVDKPNPICHLISCPVFRSAL